MGFKKLQKTPNQQSYATTHWWRRSKIPSYISQRKQKLNLVRLYGTSMDKREIQPRNDQNGYMNTKTYP